MLSLQVFKRSRFCLYLYHRTGLRSHEELATSNMMTRCCVVKSNGARYYHHSTGAFFNCPGAYLGLVLQAIPSAQHLMTRALVTAVSTKLGKTWTNTEEYYSEYVR